MKKYKIIKKIPFTTIAVGSYIMVDSDNVVKHYGKEIPIDFPSIEKEYVEPFIPKAQLYKKDSFVVSIAFTLRKEKVGRVISFDDESGTYRIEFLDGYTSYLSEDKLRPLKHYWFIDSKGAIQKDYLYRDVKADEWRKKIGNFFTDINECDTYRLSLYDEKKNV